MRRLSAIVAILFLSSNAFSGGPAFVTGSSYFDPTVKGTPVVWPQGAVNYYTDQGNLSAILPGPSADFFVASAFWQWTSISTAAISAVQAGQLAEDVSGANVTLMNGVLSIPADILPSAISTPSPSGAAVTKLMSMCLFSGWLGAILRRRMKFLALLPPPAFCECRYWPRVSQRNRRFYAHLTALARRISPFRHGAGVAFKWRRE